MRIKTRPKPRSEPRPLGSVSGLASPLTLANARGSDKNMGMGHRLVGSCAGFTLIEILIALVILSIALTTLIKATSQNIRDTIYLQDKMTATWVGMQVINETRVGIIKLPAAPSSLEKKSFMLGRQWPWQAKLERTPNAHIHKIEVDVFLPPRKTPLVHLESYLYGA